MTNDLIQTTFDYSLVSEEQASQLRVIYNRVLVRHMATAYDDGKDLLEAKSIKGLPYKDFIAWAYTVFGWSESAANEKMNIALRWGPITPRGGVIEDHAIALLSTKNVPESARQEAKEILDTGKDVSEETAKQLRDAHQAREKAEKDREKAEKKAGDTQQQFALFSQLSQDRIKELTEQIEGLQKQIKTISTPDTVEVTPPEILKQIETMKAQIATLTTQKERLSEEATKLANSLKEQQKANKAKEKQERYEAQVKDGWKKATDALFKALSQYNGQLPSSIDLQVFDAEEWARHSKIEEALRYALTQHLKLKEARYSQLVDDQVYETSLVEATGE